MNETPAQSERNVNEIATFAAGCFWGIEAAFRKIKGVSGTSVGYTGGSSDNPTYSDVCSGTTGHAEAVQLEYDPSRVSYSELLDVFWLSHNPFRSTLESVKLKDQYRSAIFFHSAEQQTAATASKESLESRPGKHVATEIASATQFYRAEERHQRYFEKSGALS